MILEPFINLLLEQWWFPQSRSEHPLGGRLSDTQMIQMLINEAHILLPLAGFSADVITLLF